MMKIEQSQVNPAVNAFSVDKVAQAKEKQATKETRTSDHEEWYDEDYRLLAMKTLQFESTFSE